MRHPLFRVPLSPSILLLGVLLGARPALPATITISCSSLGIESQMCRSGAEAWAARTGNAVRIAPTPSNAEERFSLYLTLLAAESRDVDVFQIDVTWPGMLSNHFIDLRSKMSMDVEGHAEALIKNNQYDGKLVAAPFFVDAGLLYFRRDLLERHGRKPPETWTELEETAKAVLEAERRNGNADLQGFVWQGKAYEGLACNALEWAASQGGAFIDASGEPAATSDAVVQALTRARGWIGSISPKGVLGYAEEDARSVFQSGKAVFMRNWPYAWALANAPESAVHGKVGVSPLPRGEGADGRHAATLGGQNLAVSRYSAHPAEAIDLVRHLTSAEEQKRRALEGSFNPTRPALYADQELLAANPFYADFLKVLNGAVARPSAVAGRRYNRVSYEIIQATHDALSGRGSVADNLASLQQALGRLKRDGGW